MKIMTSLTLGTVGAILMIPNIALANGDRNLQHSHTNQDLYYGFELDSQETIYQDNVTGQTYVDSQTHLQTSTNDDTSIFGGSNSRDYVNTNEGDRSTYEFGVKYEF